MLHRSKNRFECSIFHFYNFLKVTYNNAKTKLTLGEYLQGKFGYRVYTYTHSTQRRMTFMISLYLPTLKIKGDFHERIGMYHFCKTFLRFGRIFLLHLEFCLHAAWGTGVCIIFMQYECAYYFP